jgi:hypothetical protein
MTHFTKALLGTAMAVSFSFLGLFGGPDQEYGSLTSALHRTMAQNLPPYHEVVHHPAAGGVRRQPRGHRPGRAQSPRRQRADPQGSITQ